MPNWVGDVIMALPVLEDIKNNYPNAFISVLINEKHFDLLKNNDSFSEALLLKNGSESRKDIIKKIKGIGFDMGVLLTNSFSSAFLFYKANIKSIIGYKKDLRGFFLNHALPFPKEKIHQIIKYKMLLKPLQIKISSTRPKLYLNPEELAKAKQMLDKLGFQDGKRLIGINPLARYGSAKCWEEKNYISVIEKISSDAKNFIFLTGDEYSQDQINKICRGMPKNVINLAGKTNLRELIALINLSDLFITNDSGPMHIASALQIPLIAIFGSTSEILTGPYSNNSIVINKKVKCSPCYKRKCSKDFCCMKSISVNEVMDNINHILK